MRFLMAGLGLVLLAGCVTTADLEGNKPSISVVSKRDPKQYAMCVFPKWQAARTDSFMVETTNGYRLWVANSGLADELLDVTKTPNGSLIELKQRMSWSPGLGRDAIEKSVRDCL
ncbi:hypothetical protein [Pseudomonas sp.]|uniref:hypothetical protein n=1 Tax=Pseudomonas sp. TaxID=306 RepID=UPI0028B0A53F|nr:hypothetical protein [Pseudomonas sp.]